MQSFFALLFWDKEKIKNKNALCDLLIANSNKSIKVHEYIHRINPEAEQQMGLWSQLLPNSVFHTQRGVFKPSIKRGNLHKIATKLQELVKKGLLYIDPDVKSQLRENRTILEDLKNNFPLLYAALTQKDVEFIVFQDDEKSVKNPSAKLPRDIELDELNKQKKGPTKRSLK